MLDSEVKKVSVPGSPLISAADFVIPYAPDNSLSVALDYTFFRFGAGSLATNLNYAWKDDVYNTSGAGPNVPGRDYYGTRAYGLLNGRLTLEYQPAISRNPVRISLWGRNLLDADDPIYTSAIGSSFTGYSSSTFNYAEPFSYGIEVQFAL
jgi:iron complex outermembrane receptor protein